MKTTVMANAQTVVRKWVLVDAKDRPLEIDKAIKKALTLLNA